MQVKNYECKFNLLHDIPPCLSHIAEASQVDYPFPEQPFPGQDHVVAFLALQGPCIV